MMDTNKMTPQEFADKYGFTCDLKIFCCSKCGSDRTHMSWINTSKISHQQAWIECDDCGHRRKHYFPMFVSGNKYADRFRDPFEC